MCQVATVPASRDLNHGSDQVTLEPKQPLTPHRSQDEVPAPPPGMKYVLRPAPLGSEHSPVPTTPSDLWMCCVLTCLWALAHAVPAASRFLSHSSETSYSICNTPSPRKPLLTPKFVLPKCQLLWLVCGPREKWPPCSPVLSTHKCLVTAELMTEWGFPLSQFTTHAYFCSLYLSASLCPYSRHKKGARVMFPTPQPTLFLLNLIIFVEFYPKKAKFPISPWILIWGERRGMLDIYFNVKYMPVIIWPLLPFPTQTRLKSRQDK